VKHHFKRRAIVALICVVLLCSAFAFIEASHLPSYAQATTTKPLLGSAGSFAVLGGSTVTNTGPSILNGNLGVSPGSAVTGFPPGIVHGVIHKADAVGMQAQDDVTTAYNTAAGESCSHALTGQDLGGKVLVAGVYCYSSSAQLTGQLTLSGQGVYIFQIGSTLTTASNSIIMLINGASVCNIFWQVGSSATLGTRTDFKGNILALASITLVTNAASDGGLYARNGAVTLDSNTVSRADCGDSTPTPQPTGTPTKAPATGTPTTVPKKTPTSEVGLG
jgi:Ice-binding-like